MTLLLWMIRVAIVGLMILIMWRHGTVAVMLRVVMVRVVRVSHCYGTSRARSDHVHGIIATSSIASGRHRISWLWTVKVAVGWQRVMSISSTTNGGSVAAVESRHWMILLLLLRVLLSGTVVSCRRVIRTRRTNRGGGRRPHHWRSISGCYLV
jgi:hypothetical protein